MSSITTKKFYFFQKFFRFPGHCRPRQGKYTENPPKAERFRGIDFHSEERAKKNERAFEECFDRFIAKYGEEILPDLNELLDAQGYCSSDEAELYFAEVFKSGILLGLETAESMKRE